MFWIVTFVLFAALLVPAITAFSNIPQDNKNLTRIGIVVLVFLAILPGVNLLVLFGVAVYVGVKIVSHVKQGESNASDD